MSSKSKNLAAATFLIFCISNFLFAQSYFAIRLAALLFLMLSFCYNCALSRNIVIGKMDLGFYLVVISLGFYGAGIGYINNGDFQSILDGLKVYSLWGVVYLVMLTGSRAFESLLEVYDFAVILSVALIAFVNFFGAIDFYYGASLLPQGLVSEMALEFGTHDGVPRANSYNINSLVVLIPYLVASLMLNNKAVAVRSVILAIGIIVVVLSGRRALLIITMISPIIVLIVALVSKVRWADKVWKLLLGYAVITIGLLLFFDVSTLMSYVNFFEDGFGEQDERYMQREYLLSGFLDNVWLGSGFGAYIPGYSRGGGNAIIAESTYHLLLFNFGMPVFVLITSVCLFLVLKSISLIRSRVYPVKYTIPILVSFLGLLVASYSNPYLQYDTLLNIMMMVYISSNPKWRRGDRCNSS